MIGYTVACYLFFLINGLFFLLTQTLTTRYSICWLLPAGVYTLLTVPPFLTEFLGDKADFYSQLGYNMATHRSTNLRHSPSDIGTSCLYQP